MCFSPVFHRWYHAVRVILAILKQRTAFEQCSDESVNNEELRGASIPDKVMDLIHDDDYFWRNELMLRVIKPIADCVGNLEGRDAHIGLVLYEFMVLYRRIESIPSRFYSGKNRVHHQRSALLNLAVPHALDAINKRFDHLIKNDVYIVAMFLTPEYRSIALSGTRTTTENGPLRFTITNMVSAIYTLIRKMKYLDFVQDQGWRKEILDAVVLYAGNNYPFQLDPGSDPRKAADYWKQMKTFPVASMLSEFALRIFSVVFQAAPIETLFSSMGGIKSPKRNRMSVSCIINHDNIVIYNNLYFKLICRRRL